MIGRLVIFILSVVFGILAYTHSDKELTKEFVVIEKVITGDHLYLKYQEGNAEAIFEATPDQYIDANEGSLFSVYEDQISFWVYVVLGVICIIIFFASLGVDVTDMLDIIT
jgi:lipoprotein signal peptidase